LVAGSNPASGATILSNSQCFDEGQSSNSKSTNNYDTKPKNYDTFSKQWKRLYKVGKIYYYRRRIKYKLFRISLRTKDFKVALARKKLLDLLSEEEMFQLEYGDLKVYFEYETEEELKTALEKIYELEKLRKLEQYREAKQKVKAIENVPTLTFENLQIKFIEFKKSTKKVGQGSINAYLTTFKYLIEFFNDKPIEQLKLEDYEKFQKFLTDKKLSPRSINKHISYLKNFLDFAVKRKLVSENEAKNIEMLDEKKQKMARRNTIRNYNDEEIRTLLTYNFDKSIYMQIFYLLAYTGMRISEVYNLSQDNIKLDQKSGIYYFDIQNSKTLSGIRKIPIYQKLLDMNLHINFPKFNGSENAFKKSVRRRLYKALPNAKENLQNVHTLRATFIERAIAQNPDKVHIVQEIVGHAKNHNDHVTIDIYSKGYDLKIKKEIIDSIDYF